MREKEAEKSEEKLTMTVEKLRRSLVAAKTWITRTHTTFIDCSRMGNLI